MCPRDPEPTPPAEPDPDPERAFRRIAVERGFVSATDVDQAFEERRERSGRGEKLNVGQILIKRGILDPKDFLQILREVESSTAEGRTRMPEAIGKYRLVRELGRGGMGVVYEAEDPTFRRRVALKVLPDGGASATRVRRLQREARSAARLSHPNLVSVHEVGAAEDPGTGETVHYIAMEFVEGPTLRRAMTGLPLAERIRALHDVAAGAGHAHGRGVVHRDLKPENVLIAREGRTVVTDFGLATWTEGGNRLTRTGAMLGSPLYMAPEQIRGDSRRIGPATDVWSIGVMLYESLTGSMPFAAESAPALFRAVLATEPDPPRRRAPGTPVDLETICLRCLAKAPADRYTTGDELAADLARWTRGEPIETKRLPRRRTRAGRSTPVWPIAALAGALLAVASGLAVVALGRVDRAATSPDGEAREAAMAYATGDLDLAEARSRAALALDPDHALARLYLGRMHVRRWMRTREPGRPHEVSGFLEVLPAPPESRRSTESRAQAAAALAGTRGAPLARALESLAAARPSDALDALDEAASIEDERQDGWEVDVLAASALLELGRIGEARELLEPLLGLDPLAVGPLWIQVALARGVEDRLAGRDPRDWIDRARPMLRRIVEAGAADLAIRLEAALEVRAAAWQAGRGDDPEPRVERALARLEADPSAAAAIVRGDGRMVLARDRLHRGRLDRSDPAEIAAAIEAYGAALETDPHDAGARLLRAAAFHFRAELPRRPPAGRSSDLRAAAADAIEASRAAPSAIPAALAASRESIQDLDALAARHPGSARILAARADLRAIHARDLDGSARVVALEAALSDRRSAIESAPRNVELRRACARTRVDLAAARAAAGGDPLPDFDAALLELDRAIELDADDAESWSARGRVRHERAMRLRARGAPFDPEFAAAIDDLSRAIRLRPDVWIHLYGRAWARRDRAGARADDEANGFREAAIDDLGRALELAPLEVDCYRMRAMLAQRLGRLDLAIRDCENAISADPEYARRNVGIHLALAGCLEEQGALAESAGGDAGSSYVRGIAAIEAGLAIDPAYADLYRRRGHLRFRLARVRAARGVDPTAEVRAALADFDHILSTFPGDPNVEVWRRERAAIEEAWRGR